MPSMQVLSGPSNSTVLVYCEAIWGYSLTLRMFLCDALFMNGSHHHLWPLWKEDLPRGAAVLLGVVSLGQTIQALVWDLGRDHGGHGQAQAARQQSWCSDGAKYCGLSHWAGVGPGASPAAGCPDPSTLALSQCWAPQTGGVCSLGLALKKPGKNKSPFAIRAALGFSLKPLMYLWVQILEFLRYILPGPLKTSMRQEKWLWGGFLFFSFLFFFYF